MRAQYSYPVPRTGTAAVQAAGQFSAILAELFADVPYVKKLGCDALGSSVIARAVFDDNGGADYSERLDGVVRRFLAFKDKVTGGIMPEMNLRMQAAPSRRRGYRAAWKEGRPRGTGRRPRTAPQRRKKQRRCNLEAAEALRGPREGGFADREAVARFCTAMSGQRQA